MRKSTFPWKFKSAWLTAGLLSFFVLVTACHSSSSAKDVAQTFLNTYYKKADLESAKKLTTGMATFKIEQQLALGGGQANSEQMKQREVSFHILEAADKEADRKEYFYGLTIQVDKTTSFQRKVRLSLEPTGEKNHWKVVNFVEVST